ncbi:MAG: hypothetical protein ACKVT1_13500 [Dehalococcoidia bacterium]
MTTPRAVDPALSDAGTGLLTEAEAAALFDQACHEWLDMSTDEFLKKLDAGGFGDDLDYWPVINVAGLLYLVRPSEW